MAEQVIVPKLGMASAMATLTEWKVKEGGRIEKGENVLDIEAEKSVFEMTATATGFLHMLYPQGEEVDVSTVVGLIAATQEEYDALVKGSSGDAPEAPASAPVTAGLDVTKGAPQQGERKFITPIARRMAAENDIDIACLVGSGPHGRIQRDDVRREIDARQKASTQSTTFAQPDTAKAEPARMVPVTADGGLAIKEVVPYRGMRRAIGENMMRSLAINAPNTMSGDFDLTVATKYRDNFVQHERRLGTRITVADMMIHAVARVLGQVPLMNSSLIGDEVRCWDAVNIGMAVALGDYGEKGLIVPVIKDADKKSLVEISKETKELGAKARADKLVPGDMKGGTFTVSNFGSLGVSSYSTPIINVPESAIIAIGRLQKKPIVRNDGITIAPMLPYSMTHDHRVIDGAVAEYFLGLLKRQIESTNAELNELILF